MLWNWLQRSGPRSAQGSSPDHWSGGVPVTQDLTGPSYSWWCWDRYYVLLTPGPKILGMLEHLGLEPPLGGWRLSLSFIMGLDIEPRSSFVIHQCAANKLRPWLTCPCSCGCQLPWFRGFSVVAVALSLCSYPL